MATPLAEFRARKKRERETLGPDLPNNKSARLRRAARSAVKPSDLRLIMKKAIEQAQAGDSSARAFVARMGTYDPGEIEEWVKLNEELRKKLVEVQARNAELETEVARLKGS